MKKVLNLYAGIGGNRRGWGNDYHITAVEYNSEIAKAYGEHFPNDTIIVGDALEYLVNHYHEYDFIWASPPCPTHSQFRYYIGVKAKGYTPVIPEMTSLYGIITFLKHHFNGGWAVENVRSYYEPLKIASNGLAKNNKISEAQEANGFDISQTKIKNKRQVLRNCTESEVGSHIIKEWEEE